MFEDFTISSCKVTFEIVEVIFLEYISIKYIVDWNYVGLFDILRLLDDGNLSVKIDIDFGNYIFKT